MSNDLNDFLDTAGKLVKVVPTVYEDLLQPAVKETGVIISKLPKAINAALIGIDCWVEEKKYKLDETKKLLEHKLESVDPSKIVSPEPYVAVPALQAISYSMNSAELRDLFANLLAKSMNVDTKDSVHPAFVDLIKQLSPIDASNLKYINQAQSAPIATIRAFLAPDYSSGRDIFSHLFIANPHCQDDQVNSVSIANLSRLGLVTTIYDGHLTEVNYDHFYANLTYISAKDYFTATNTRNKTGFTHVDIKKGMVNITPLGESFCSICTTN